ncbi:MAG: HEAT repeat protein [Planctomycetota bacterium]
MFLDLSCILVLHGSLEPNFHMQNNLRALLVVPVFALLSAPCWAQVDEAKLRDKSPDIRQATIEQAIEVGGEDVPKWLLKALKDKDWGVVLAAAKGLATHGSPAAIKELQKLAMEAPLFSIRRAALDALAIIDPEKSADAFYKKAKGKTAEVAAFALSRLAKHGVLPAKLTKLEKLASHREPEYQPAGIKAWVACSKPEDQPAVLAQALGSERLLLRTQAAEAAAVTCNPACLPVLREKLMEEGVNPVLERRLIRAIVACATVGEDKAERAALLGPELNGLGTQQPGGVARARILEAFVDLVEDDWRLAEIKKLTQSDDVDVRRAALKSLGSISGAASLGHGVELMADETNSDAMEPLILSVLKLGGLDDEEARKALHRCITDELGTLASREDLCVALAHSTIPAAQEILVEASASIQGDLAQAALVAVGKGRGPKALEILTKAMDRPDWRDRGAAAVGLMHLALPECMGLLMKASEDEDPSVALTANRGLLRLSGRASKGAPKQGWEDWWKESQGKVSLRQREKSQSSFEKYGYTVPDALIYAGLDVVVIPGRGDHIETVLDRLGIIYRTVQAGQLAKQGLHPGAVLIAGCTGEIAPSDVPIVQWYVRCGGSLFTSCWSLTFTAQRAFPGVIVKADTDHEVMDRVRTEPAALGSTFLNGVFEGGSVPIYHLEGAHLIRVVDSIRAEVLIDSPEAAERHGSGDMAAWFRVGHGTVLDSVNHFDLQGLALATDLKKKEELQAYAVNHMGLSMSKLRLVAQERWWKSRDKASKNVDDMSAFRLLTNFVREKRLRGD